MRLIPIYLTKKQREQLLKIVKAQTSEQRMVFRASIILELDSRKFVENVAVKFNTTTKTVKKWGHRFLKLGLKGLNDLPRSGAPGKFSVEQRCEVISIACDKPENYGYSTFTHWTKNTLTGAVNNNVEGPNMSASTVYRTLNENELKPNKVEMWLHSPDPNFREKVNRIVSIYNNPPEDVVILSIDEKTGMQAIERKYETEPARPGRLARQEFEYIRHGTQSLITAFNIKTGEVDAYCGDTRKGNDLEAFMEQIATKYSYAPEIIIIWDNLNIHHDGPNKRWTKFNEKHNNKFKYLISAHIPQWEQYKKELNHSILGHSSWK